MPTQLQLCQAAIRSARYYSNASPFNQPIPWGAARHANSDAIVGRLNGLGPPARFNIGATGADDWTHPLYFATNGDPVYRVSSSGWRNPDTDGALIHVPTYARPAGGNDASMAVVQPPNSSGEVWEYDFWRAAPPASNILACDFARRGLFNGDGLGGAPERGGITAARFSNALGLIRYDEMVAGVIPHALFMSVHGWHGRVWPSLLTGGTTGGVVDANAPAMGQHFALAMTEAEILEYPAWQGTILRAMRDYGCYVGDNGSAPWALQLESGTQYTAQGQLNPWIDWAKYIGAVTTPAGTYKVDFGAGVDWSRLYVIA